MTFEEKLKEWLKGRSRAGLARLANLRPTVINNYLTGERRSAPMAQTALKLARAMSVPLEWLVDDKQGWPPPDSIREREEAATKLPDQQIIREFLRRRLLAQMDLADKLDAAEQQDWRAVREKLSTIPPGERIPSDLFRATLLPLAVNAAVTRLFHFHLNAIEELLPDVGDRAKATQENQLEERYKRLWDDPEFQAATKEIASRPRSRQEDVERQLLKWLASTGGIIKLRPDQDEQGTPPAESSRKSARSPNVKKLTTRARRGS